MKRFLFFSLLLMLSILLLVSCGGDPDAGTTAPQTSATTTAAITTTAEFEYVEYTSGIGLTRYTGTNKHIIIPSEINGRPVIMLEADFLRKSEVESVYIPDSVKNIGRAAFRECKSLTSVRLSENLQRIQADAFRDCSALTQIVIPSCVYMEDNAFTDCTSLASVTLPDNLTNWGESHFYGCVMLAEVIFEDGMEQLMGTWLIGSGVKRITIPASVSILRADFVITCESLESITFLGDAPDMRGLALASPYVTETPHDYTATIYYPKGTKGWENFMAHECYQFFSQ